MKQLTNKYYEILQFRDTIEKNGMVNTIGSAFYTESEAIKMLGKQCDNMSHDKLQSDCFVWFHNNHPELRYLMHANINSHAKWKVQDLVKLKSIGLVKGIMDLEFYYNKVLYVFDIKMPGDRLSKQQLEFIAAIEKQGGKGYEIRSFEEFKQLIEGIL